MIHILLPCTNLMVAHASKLTTYHVTKFQFQLHQITMGIRGLDIKVASLK